MNEHTAPTESQQCVSNQLVAPGEAGGGPVASAEARPTGEAGSRSLNVTRPAQISGEKECRVLLAGIDSLDFGMYVEFGASWWAIVAKLAQLKTRARGTSGHVIGGGRCAVLPGGKPNYPFHVQYPGFQLYLSRKSKPDGETPNVFVSLNSQLLWERGERGAVELVQKELTELADGTIHECRMSRCDLTADLLVPGGVTDRFVREHAVSRVRNQRIFLDSDAMQTLYVGAPDSDISMRIYDKSAEILHSQKFWFLPLWGLEENADVWRFEFQLRRPILKAYQVNSLDELMAKRGALWQCLTEDWFSLRLHDNENVTRRTVHPLWQTLCECAERFGPCGEPLQRLRCRPSTDSKGVVQQAAARLVGFGAREHVTDYEPAIQQFVDALRAEFEGRNFTEECQRKAIQLGINLTEEKQ